MASWPLLHAAETPPGTTQPLSRHNAMTAYIRSAGDAKASLHFLGEIDRVCPSASLKKEQ
jgi:hypothetical protein